MTCPGFISQEGSEWHPSLIWTNVKLVPHGPKEETQPGPEGLDSVSQPARALTPPPQTEAAGQHWAATWRPASLGRGLCLDPALLIAPGGGFLDTCCVLQNEQGMSE